MAANNTAKLLNALVITTLFHFLSPPVLPSPKMKKKKFTQTAHDESVTFLACLMELISTPHALPKVRSGLRVASRTGAALPRRRCTGWAGWDETGGEINPIR